MYLPHLKGFIWRHWRQMLLSQKEKGVAFPDKTRQMGQGSNLSQQGSEYVIKHLFMYLEWQVDDLKKRFSI